MICKIFHFYRKNTMAKVFKDATLIEEIYNNTRRNLPKIILNRFDHFTENDILNAEIVFEGNVKIIVFSVF